MTTFDKQVKAAVFARQKGVCAFCGWGLNELLEDTEMKSVEFHHVQPQRERGANDADNCVVLCSYTSLRAKDGCHHHVHEGGRFRDGVSADPEYFKYSHAHETAAHDAWVLRWRKRYGYPGRET
ncbi:MAG: HNH endonuclease [Aquincola tertiaricarbonis]